MPDEKKSFWDKLEVVSKASMPLVLAGVGFLVSKTLNDLQSRDSDTRLYTQLMTQREDADTVLRRSMFESALKTFLETRPGTPERDLLNLELMAFNFHESLNLKALFHDLQRKILLEPDGEKQRFLMKRLQDLAAQINEKQIGVLQEAGAVAKAAFNLDQTEWDPVSGFVSLEARVAGTEVPGRDKRPYSIQLLGVDQVKQQLRLNLQVSGPQEPGGVGPAAAPEFHNWYFYADQFDFPMVENLRLSHGQRCAVVVTELSEAVARVSLIFFPGSRASLKEKPYYDEVLDELVHTQKSLQAHP